METKSQTLTFGDAIAFVAPGFLVTAALLFCYREEEVVESGATNIDKANHALGVFLFVALASLSVGLVVSGLRQLVLDKWLLDRISKTSERVRVPTIPWHLMDGPSFEILIALRDAYLRFYQFYANTAFALLPSGFIVGSTLECSGRIWVAVGVVAAVPLLIVSGCVQRNFYADSIQKLFDGKTTLLRASLLSLLTEPQRRILRNLKEVQREGSLKQDLDRLLSLGLVEKVASQTEDSLQGEGPAVDLTDKFRRTNDGETHLRLAA